MARMINPFLNSKKRGLSVILNYHSINPDHKDATKPHEFSQQMEYLASNFRVISLPAFYKMKVTQNFFFNRIAIVTLDDGYEDNYIHAFPVMVKLKIPATIFLSTGFINKEIDITRRWKTYDQLLPLEWNQIIEMRNGDISFGAHTHTHPILTDISLEKAEEEITKSKHLIEVKLNESIDMFAYPLGQKGCFNRKIVDILKQTGFKLACSTIWGTNNSDTDVFALHRVRVDAADTIEDFKSKVNGNWDFVKWVQIVKRYL